MSRLFWLLAIIAALGLTPAYAQAHGSLTITVHDENGTPLPAITIIARSAHDEAELQRVTTDNQGVARFPTLPIGTLRIQLVGRTLIGRPLIQPGLDAQGIVVQLAAGDQIVNLRTQPDGIVVPDPATMLALDAQGVPIDPAASHPPFPTILPAASVTSLAPASQDMTAITLLPPTIDGPLTTTATSGREPDAIGRVVLVCALLGIGVVVLLMRAQRRRTR